jgi:hypothetical protein
MYLPSFPNLDLFSAGVNALNGVLIARNPSPGAALVSFLFRVFARRGHWPQVVPMNAPAEGPAVGHRSEGERAYE